MLNISTTINGTLHEDDGYQPSIFDVDIEAFHAEGTNGGDVWVVRFTYSGTVQSFSVTSDRYNGLRINRNDDAEVADFEAVDANAVPAHILTACYRQTVGAATSDEVVREHDGTRISFRSSIGHIVPTGITHLDANEMTVTAQSDNLIVDAEMFVVESANFGHGERYIIGISQNIPGDESGLTVGYYFLGASLDGVTSGSDIPDRRFAEPNEEDVFILFSDLPEKVQDDVTRELVTAVRSEIEISRFADMRNDVELVAVETLRVGDAVHLFGNWYDYDGVSINDVEDTELRLVAAISQGSGEQYELTFDDGRVVGMDYQYRLPKQTPAVLSGATRESAIKAVKLMEGETKTVAANIVDGIVEPQNDRTTDVIWSYRNKRVTAAPVAALVRSLGVDAHHIDGCYLVLRNSDRLLVLPEDEYMDWGKANLFRIREGSVVDVSSLGSLKLSIDPHSQERAETGIISDGGVDALRAAKRLVAALRVRAGQ